MCRVTYVPFCLYVWGKSTAAPPSVIVWMPAAKIHVIMDDRYLYKHAKWNKPTPGRFTNLEAGTSANKDMCSSMLCRPLGWSSPRQKRIIPPPPRGGGPIALNRVYPQGICYFLSKKKNDRKRNEKQEQPFLLSCFSCRSRKKLNYLIVHQLCGKRGEERWGSAEEREGGQIKGIFYSKFWPAPAPLLECH